MLHFVAQFAGGSKTSCFSFVSSLQHNYGTDPKGKSFEFMIRVTDCFRKVNGKWKIVHQHVSFPIESMETGKADFQSKL